MNQPIDFLTRGKKKAAPAEQAATARSTILDMEEPIQKLGQLVGGIMALAEDRPGDPDDEWACYALARKADEVLDHLRDLWESSVDLGRAGTPGRPLDDGDDEN
jgi:hypothetical protein